MFPREVHEKVTLMEVLVEVREDVLPMEVREDVIPREVHEELVVREEIPGLVIEPARDVTPPTVDKGKGVVDVGVHQGDVVQEDETREKDITPVPSKEKCHEVNTSVPSA